MSTLLKKRIVDPVLTNIARGFTNASHVAVKLFPIVTVSKEGGKIPQFTKEAFKIYNSERAIRAKSNRINPENRTEIDFVLTEHDLEYPIDYREQEEDVFPSRLHATTVVTDGISLRLEKLAADIAQNLATYPTGNKVTLAAGDKFTNTSSNPFVIFDAAKEAVRGKIAQRPNVCVLGPSAFNALKNHPAVLERIKYTQQAIITAELLRALLDFDELYVGDAVYSTDAGVFTDIWSDNAIVAYVPKANTDVPRSYYEPAFGYTLRKRNNPMIDSYTEGGKVEIIRNTDIFIPKVVGSDAGYLINDTNA
ncbi:MAG: major capsid protein [Ignavibacteriales bacterium]|nr:MAG: major capsid protein [Ignavibacteriales bacterium]